MCILPATGREPFSHIKANKRQLIGQFCLRFNKLFQREFKIRPRVRSRNLSADASLSMGYHRIRKCDNINALGEKEFRHSSGGHSIPEHHRHDGVIAGENFEARRRHLRTEKGGIFLQLFPQRGRLGYELQSL